jgi:hypothetical protein
MRSPLCNILAASSGRKGECGQLVTNHFEGIGVVLGAQLTRTIFTTELAVAKVAFSIEFQRQEKDSTRRNVVLPPSRRSHYVAVLISENPVYQDLAYRHDMNWPITADSLLPGRRAVVNSSNQFTTILMPLMIAEYSTLRQPGLTS